MASKFKNYCLIYIVRHGETVWNIEERMQGNKDSPLTPIGIRQAKKLASKLKKIKFAAAFSSDLLRAQKTAEIIALEHNLAVTTNKLLRERNFGRFEGIKFKEYQDQLKDLLDKRETLSHKERFSFKLASDIESDDEIVSRFITFLRETALAYIGKNVLVVTHGAMIVTLLLHLGFYESYQQIPPHAVKNAALVKLQSNGVEFFIKETQGIVSQQTN